MNNLSRSYLRDQNNSTYEMSNGLGQEKDIQISQLKSKLYEYEQNEKSYKDLQSKFRGLQNEYQMMNEAKLRLEYELRQKTEANNKFLAELKNQNENLLNELSGKNVMNKKLFNDNNNLFRTLESKNKENDNLKSQYAQNEETIAMLSEKKDQCEREMDDLNSQTRTNEVNMTQLSQELNKLNMQVGDQDKILNAKTSELNRNQQMLNDLKSENDSLMHKLQAREEGLNSAKEHLDMANMTITQIEKDFNSLHSTFDKTREDLALNKNNFDKERAIRGEAERNNQHLEMLIKEKNDTLNKHHLTNDSLKMNMDQLGGQRQNLIGEVSRYNNYIITLTEQNQKVSCNYLFIPIS